MDLCHRTLPSESTVLYLIFFLFLLFFGIFAVWQVVPEDFLVIREEIQTVGAVETHPEGAQVVRLFCVAYRDACA